MRQAALKRMEKGTLAAHESSCVNGKRNLDLSRYGLGQRRLSAYGPERMIWSSGLAGMDITDHHIDSLVLLTGLKGRWQLPEYPEADDLFFSARENRLFAR